MAIIRETRTLQLHNGRRASVSFVYDEKNISLDMVDRAANTLSICENLDGTEFSYSQNAAFNYDDSSFVIKIQMTYLNDFVFAVPCEIMEKVARYTSRSLNR